MTLREQIQSFDYFDQRLRDEYARFARMFPDKPDAFIQRRFAEYGIFPNLGWSLLNFGYSEALSRNHPLPILEAIWRFTNCAHACWGHADERDLHHGGYDFCALVIPALYSILLDDSYFQSTFTTSRKMSTASHPAYMHAANLILCTEHPDWPHSEKSVARSRTFVLAKSNAKVDKSFVGIFLGILNRDENLITTSLVDYSKGYDKSDWGKYKPGTRPLFLQSLSTYAKRYSPASVMNAESSLFSENEIELFQQLNVFREGFASSAHRFDEPLQFLNA